MMTAEQLRRCAGLVARLAALRATAPDQMASDLAEGIVASLNAPDLSAPIELLENLIAEEERLGAA